MPCQFGSNLPRYSCSHALSMETRFLPGGPTHNLVYPNGSGSTNIPTVSTNSPGGYHESKAHLLPKNLTHVQSEKGDNDMGTGSRCSTFKTYINPRDTNPSGTLGFLSYASVLFRGMCCLSRTRRKHACVGVSTICGTIAIFFSNACAMFS